MFLAYRAARSPALLFAFALSIAAPAHAKGSGTAVLARANEKWKLGAYASAERLYAEAIDRGDLSPAEVLDGYVHLGAVRVLLGNAGDALAAFREAALIDPHFVLPREAATLSPSRRASKGSTSAPIESARMCR